MKSEGAANVYELFARRLYREAEKVDLNPGDTAQVNRRQVRMMQDDVAKARAEGRLTVAGARRELAVLNEIRRELDRSPFPVGIRLAPADRELSIRHKVRKAQRNKRKSEKQSRAAGRPAKKSKSRKRR